MAAIKVGHLLHFLPTHPTTALLAVIIPNSMMHLLPFRVTAANTLTADVAFSKLPSAKAAGLLCVLGIGLGIGSLLIYRLFKKYQCSNDLPDKSDDECYVRLESVDTVFNKEEMGHGYSSHDLPAAHYTPDTGVSFLLDSYKEIPSQEAIHIPETPVRHRKLGPNNPSKDCCKPEIPTVDSDTKMLLTDERWSESASGGDLQSQEDDCSVSSCPQSFTSSLMGNYSPRSLRERNLMIENDAFQSERTRTTKKSSCKEKPLQNNHHNDKVNINKHLKESSVLLTPPSEEDSPPTPYQLLIKKSKLLEADSDKEDDNYDNSENYLNSNNKYSPDDDLDNSIFSELSFSSKSLSPPSRRDWSLDDEEKDLLSPLSCPSSSLDQLPQLLIRRLRECKSVSPESSRSGTSDDCLSPESQKEGIVLERCDSIDSSIFEIINDVPKQIAKDEVLRFHGIEDELQDLNDEMDDLMSGLSHLKSKCPGIDPEEIDLQRQMLLSEQAYIALQKARAHCGKRPGSLTPDSSIGDFQSPTDNFLSWDMTDFKLDGISYDNESNVIGIINEQNCVPFSVVDSDNNFEMSTLHNDMSTLHNDMSTLHNDMSTLYNDNQYYSTTEEGEPEKGEPEKGNSGNNQPEADDENINHNVGPRKSLQLYSQDEWLADNEGTRRYRRAIHAIQQDLNCNYIRFIRGDNYCGVRACVVQVLMNGIAIKQEFATAEIVKELLNQYMEEPEWEIGTWSFANRLNYSDVKAMLISCIDEFYLTHNLALQMDARQRENWVADHLNNQPIVDIKIMEAAKLLMLLDIINIYKNRQANDFPIFVQFIFARDTSTTPAQLLKGILNHVGDGFGLEQIDMSLLGHALGVTIVVPRLYRYERDDFILKFPDLLDQDRGQEVLLIVVDDRHYNILIRENREEGEQFRR